MSKRHPQSKTKPEVEKLLKQACDKEYRRDSRLFTTTVLQKDHRYDPKSRFSYWRPRLGVFKGSNWDFDPLTLRAFSYDWWPMLLVDGKKLIRNTCNYSQSTAKHQRRIDHLIRSLGITPDITVSVRSSLSETDSVKAELIRDWAKEEIRVKRARVYKTNCKQDEIDQAKRWLKITKADLAKALATAEADHKFMLEQKREHAKRKKQREQEIEQEQEQEQEHITFRNLRLDWSK